MFKVVLLAFLAAYAAADNVHPREYYQKLFFEHLNQFKLEFKNGSEFVQKLQTFANNIDTIEKHNADSTQTFKMGANQFTHLTYDEWQDEVKVGIRIPNLRRNAADIHAEPADRASLPATVDWVSAGAVTPVKNQGSCGSCWTFSTTGALEGAYKIKYGTLKSFSEQELVSCDNSGQDHGCNGGWMDDAFDWVKSNGGITTEDQYPYTSGNGKTGTCQKTGYTNDPKVAPTKHVDVQTKNVNALMSAVAQQPVSIAIEADQPAFQHYSSGVLTSGCGQNLDHGVLLVGYGTESGTDYWKVKNSWGTSWGEQGYIKIARSSADLCGVLDAPSYPVL